MLSFKKKNAEILLLIDQLNELYTAEPWHGKGIKAILEWINPDLVFERPNGQHSILELVWHMMNWKEFALNRLIKSDKDLQHFEESDWRELDHTNKALWQKGLNRFWEAHHQFIEVLKQQDDKLLDQIVQGRKYNYRKLLNGIREHDLYHSGQIAYINKLLTAHPVPIAIGIPGRKAI